RINSCDFEFPDFHLCGNDGGQIVVIPDKSLRYGITGCPLSWRMMMESHHRASNPRGNTPVKPMPSERFRRHRYG
ncbi:TPA: hypothetical protein ACQUHZ_001543, partial [Neisseria cinerea]